MENLCGTNVTVKPIKLVGEIMVVLNYLIAWPTLNLERFKNMNSKLSYIRIVRVNFTSKMLHFSPQIDGMRNKVTSKLEGFNLNEVVRINMLVVFVILSFDALVGSFSLV